MDRASDFPRHEVKNGKRSFDRLAAEWWLVLLLATALVVCSVATNLSQRIDMLFYDLVQRHSSHAPQPQILLVSIDDHSLAELGPWPWPRAREALLLEELAKGKPRAVALDLLLVDPGDPLGDNRLAKAIASGPPTYLPMYFDVSGQEGTGFDVVKPLPIFAEGAAGLGQVSLTPDTDGIVRRAYLSYSDGQRSWPHLVTWLAGTARSNSIPTATNKTTPSLEARDPVMIAYAGSRGSFATIQAVSVIRGEVPTAAIAGRLVLVGVTATGLGDNYSTPVGSDRTLMPGLEIQANLLDTILSKRLATPAEGACLYVFALAPLLAMMLSLRRMPPRWTIWALVGLIATVLVTAGALLAFGRLWIGPGSALAGLMVVYPLWNWRRLAAVSVLIGEELERLEAEHDPLERARPNLAREDFVGRQIKLLRSAINRERDMRRFLVDRINQMPDAVLVTDTADRVAIANQAAGDLWHSLGGRGSLTSGRQLLGLLSPSKAIAQMEAPAAGSWQAEIEAPDGRTFALRFEPQRAADETTIGAVIRIVDATEARLAQRQREDVLQLLSHDMRSPQVSILTLLESEEAKHVAPGLVRRLRGYADITLKLADGFVHLARAQTLRFEPQPVDMVDLVQEAADSLWPQARAQSAEIVCRVPEAELWVLGDRSLLARMMVNLIDNAVRYSRAGQIIEVTLTTELALGGSVCVASVADQGPGMDSEQLERLFQRFQSGGTPRINMGGGVGLGLAFVHATVLRHAGRIKCNSTQGVGTKFTVELPLCETFD
ncbi:MAG: CHASE2 domain-containing protein [Sphingomonadales bacterium]|nr:CHASE2 domain-containing protein [Sphingomonadales bacterium]